MSFPYYHNCDVPNSITEALKNLNDTLGDLVNQASINANNAIQNINNLNNEFLRSEPSKNLQEKGFNLSSGFLIYLLKDYQEPNLNDYLKLDNINDLSALPVITNISDSSFINSSWDTISGTSIETSSSWKTVPNSNKLEPLSSDYLDITYLNHKLVIDDINLIISNIDESFMYVDELLPNGELNSNFKFNSEETLNNLTIGDLVIKSISNIDVWEITLDKEVPYYPRFSDLTLIRNNQGFISSANSILSNSSNPNLSSVDDVFNLLNYDLTEEQWLDNQGIAVINGRYVPSIDEKNIWALDTRAYKKLFRNIKNIHKTKALIESNDVIITYYINNTVTDSKGNVNIAPKRIGEPNENIYDVSKTYNIPVDEINVDMFWIDNIDPTLATMNKLMSIDPIQEHISAFLSGTSFAGSANYISTNILTRKTVTDINNIFDDVSTDIESFLNSSVDFIKSSKATMDDINNFLASEIANKTINGISTMNVFLDKLNLNKTIGDLNDKLKIQENLDNLANLGNDVCKILKSILSTLYTSLNGVLNIAKELSQASLSLNKNANLAKSLPELASCLISFKASININISVDLGILALKAISIKMNALNVSYNLAISGIRNVSCAVNYFIEQIEGKDCLGGVFPFVELKDICEDFNDNISLLKGMLQSLNSFLASLSFEPTKFSSNIDSGLKLGLSIPEMSCPGADAVNNVLRALSFSLQS